MTLIVLYDFDYAKSPEVMEVVFPKGSLCGDKFNHQNFLKIYIEAMVAELVEATSISSHKNRSSPPQANDNAPQVLHQVYLQNHLR